MNKEAGDLEKQMFPNEKQLEIARKMKEIGDSAEDYRVINKNRIGHGFSKPHDEKIE